MLGILGIQAAVADANGTATDADTVQSAVQEIVVTARRRETSISDIPYNISAVSSADLALSNTNSLAGLAAQVPGFNLADRGARYAGAELPIIRGLNASSAIRNGFVVEQMPAGTYIGDSPVAGYFPLTDMQRVEALRGPQGTLYGAGALGGTI